MAQRTTNLKLLEAIEPNVDKQNLETRRARLGPAAEKVRQIGIERLRGHINAFYEHGSVADVFLLCAAFEKAERDSAEWSPERAVLVDSLFSICGGCSSGHP